MKVPVRDAFPHEAHDFTVWLEQNIDELAEQINLPMVVEERERQIGRFSADLVCRDTSGNRIVIENQLESTDHDHLGKMMTYMGNLKANTAIWITPEPRIEHQTAIEHFNSIQIPEMNFYLVQLEAVRIGDSPAAPLFTVLVRPLDESAPVSETEIEKYTTLEISSEADNKPEGLSPAWCVYPIRDDDTYRLFLSENLVGLGFGNLGDLAKLPATPEAFRKAWAKRNWWQSEAQIRAFYPMFYSFAHRVNIGDLVIYPPTWRERIIHVGEITGDYMYRGGFLRTYRDVRPVRWIASIPRDEFSSTALKGIRVNLAFFQVRNEDFLNELAEKLRQE